MFFLDSGVKLTWYMIWRQASSNRYAPDYYLRLCSCKVDACLWYSPPRNRESAHTAEHATLSAQQNYLQQLTTRSRTCPLGHQSPRPDLLGCASQCSEVGHKSLVCMSLGGAEIFTAVSVEAEDLVQKKRCDIPVRSTW